MQENTHKYTILIAEDEAINFLFLEILLKKQIDLGCAIIHAKNGAEAVEICKKNDDINLVLMDLKMPVMDGINATKTLRKKYQENLAPIYGLSAQIPKNLHKTPKELGFDFYLTKPLSLETLKQSLNKIV